MKAKKKGTADESINCVPWLMKAVKAAAYQSTVSVSETTETHLL